MALGLERLSLRIRILLFFAALWAGCIAVIVTGLALGFRRLGTPEALNAFVQAGLLAGFGALGIVAWVWYLFDLHVAKPVGALAGALRARAHADVAGDIDEGLARYLGDLAPAATAAARRLAETRDALAEAVARETARLATEKARLETLLADVPVGVLLCSAEHQLAFYNGTATDLMGVAGAAPGLDRGLFEYLHEGPLRHAHDRLIDSGDADAASDLLCTTVAGARVLAARMRLLAGGVGRRPGYVLTLRDVTADLAAHARREALIAELFDRVRRPAANLRTVLEVLPPGDPVPPRLDAALRDEVAALTRAITDLAARHDEGRSEDWPLALTRASDLADGIAARAATRGVPLSATSDPLILRCNGFEIIALFGQALENLTARGMARDMRFDLAEEGSDALLRLTWEGAALGVGDLDRWLAGPLDPALPGVTGRTVLTLHATECWPEPAGPGRHALTLPLRAARRAVRRPAPIARAVVYDFDLLSRARSAAVADSRLSDLTYVVFDTETTGLLPDQGDEIVQIAAVRIVNGRRVEGEVFDTLVNPRRPIPASSTEVHGITEAMVAEAPGIEEVGRAFHRFAEGAVLIAHNAPFDMQFLRRHEPAIGASFDHPILDTVLLSAVVFGQAETHSLDALTHRLGITIPDEARHTALGDTLATADAFLKLLPMLSGRGFRTFGEVLAEVRRHGRLLKDLN